jgi:hypothetical protein
MPGLTHRIAAADALLLRSLARGESIGPEFTAALDRAGRYYLPIELTEATGRAHCRLCGQLIAKGEQCVRFELAVSGRGSAPTATAYLHSDC